MSTLPPSSPPPPAPLAGHRGATHRTPLGHYQVDAAGLWHYVFDSFGHVGTATIDALVTGPTVPLGPRWFWFNDTPAPTLPGDTAGQLEARWADWRKAYQSEPRGLLSMLLEMRGGAR